MLDSSYQGAKRLFVLAYDKIDDNNQFSINSFKKYFLLRVKEKITTSKLMEENFMISQLSNTTKSEKYQRDKVMITQLVVC